MAKRKPKPPSKAERLRLAVVAMKENLCAETINNVVVQGSLAMRPGDGLLYDHVREIIEEGWNDVSE
jgi:hypothetical protein